VSHHAALEALGVDRRAREAADEVLEQRLVVDRHAEHLCCFGELRLQVAGVAEAGRALCADAMLGAI